MKLVYKHTESVVEPSEIEICGNTVYIRKDIMSEEREGFSDAITFWTYQEATLSLDEFEEYSKVANAKTANGVDQIMVNQETGDTNQLIIMEAIADLYEAIANVNQGGLS